MNVWQRLFIEHPASVRESYWQHMASATGFGIRMVFGGLVCLIHAVVPAIGSATASDMITRLYERMVMNRRRLAEDSNLPLETRRAA
ncbi:MAG: DUF6356 family protein [Steroidobacteraceae bacterium]